MIKSEDVKNFFETNAFEIASFITYILGTILVSLYHEHWYDELQAYAIAKDNLHNIIYMVPHYEGHSPLWYFILKFFQQFSSNPDIVLKIPNLLFAYIAVWLLIFKSPFPKILRCVLPFTFFIFYQYAILCRPYSLLILGLFWAASLYKERNIHPYLFSVALALAAATCGYGMVLCASICIEWGLNILFVERKTVKEFFGADRRFLAMLILFFLCLLLTAVTLPAKDCLYERGLSWLIEWQRNLYFLLGLPADATAFNVYNYTKLSVRTIFSTYTVFSWIFGGYILLRLFEIFKVNRQLPLFLICYFPLAFAMYKLPYCSHHTGFVFILFIYLFWCLMSNKAAVLCHCVKYVVAGIIIVQLYWCGCAVKNEILYNYDTSRDIVEFIKKYDLTRYKIMCASDSNIPDVQWLSVAINSYMGRNIIYTFNMYEPDRLYFIRKRIGRYKSQIIHNEWREAGVPDIFISKRPFDRDPYLRDRMKIGEMRVVKEIPGGWIYKDVIAKKKVYIYMRENVAKEIFKNGDIQSKNHSLR